MGRAVQVDPVMLDAGARRLAGTAGTLDTLSARLAGLGASAALAAPGLAGAVDGTGRELGRALAACAEVVERLGLLTARAGDDYAATEEALTASWDGPAEGPGPR